MTESADLLLVVSEIELDMIAEDMCLGVLSDELVDWLGVLWLARYARTFPHLHFTYFVMAWRDVNRYRPRSRIGARPTRSTGRRKEVRHSTRP